MQPKTRARRSTARSPDSAADSNVTAVPAESAPNNSLRSRALGVGAAAGAAAIGTVVYNVDPTKPSLLPGCPLYLLTGIWCPGCGATRSLHSLLTGDVASFFTYNPLFAVALPLVVFLLARFIVRLLRGRAPTAPLATMSPGAGWTVLAVFVTYFVLRNVPLAPFTLLAPHAA